MTSCTFFYNISNSVRLISVRNSRGLILYLFVFVYVQVQGRMADLTWSMADMMCLENIKGRLPVFPVPFLPEHTPALALCQFQDPTAASRRAISLAMFSRARVSSRSRMAPVKYSLGVWPNVRMTASRPLKKAASS